MLERLSNCRASSSVVTRDLKQHETFWESVRAPRVRSSHGCSIEKVPIQYLASNA